MLITGGSIAAMSFLVPEIARDFETCYVHATCVCVVSSSCISKTLISSCLKCNFNLVNDYQHKKL